MSNRYSTIFESKLPSFIRDDPSYTKFVDFFTAYYEWFDDTYDIMGFGDKLDIDAGFADFVAYFKEDFLPYFPDDIATDKVKLIKLAKELYKAKGIPDSFKFLFRALYNVNVDVFTTREYVLRPSDGKWIVPKSIKIKSLDTNFLNINNFIVFGELSKTIGVIEKSRINGKFIQIYLSNIQRLYYSGEPIRILDNKSKDVYFLNGEYVQYDSTPPTNAVLLSSKIIGALSNIDIVSTRRGQNYKVGYPVVVSGGLNPEINNQVGAIATITEVTAGQIQRVRVTDGGYGYQKGANSKVDVIYNGAIDTIANCSISLLDESRAMNVSLIASDLIGNNYSVLLGNSNFNFKNSANANTILSDALSFLSFATYPIVDILVTNGGGGYEFSPTLDIESLFKVYDTRQDLSDLGILAPIEILNPGTGYTTGDSLTLSGGDGDFAYARITSVGLTGTITGVEYYLDPNYPYSIGGMGYNLSNLPSIQITSATGSNGSLIVPGIMGTGVKYNLETDRVGAITKITLSENGEDYISTPNVSLRVQDIAVTDVYGIELTETTIAYQGNLLTPTFFSYVDSVRNIDEGNPLVFVDDIFALRVYNYKGVISDSTLTLYDTFTETSIGTVTINASYTNSLFTNGIKIYGDGSAKATAKFLNGIIVDSGRYLNSDGQPSSHSVLQNDIYNSTTYIISTEKDYNSYKNSVTNLLHPTGTRLVTRNLMKSNSNFIINTTSAIQFSNNASGIELSLISSNTNYSNSFYVYYESYWGDDDWGNQSWGTAGASNFEVNTKINIITTNNMNVYSIVTSIDTANDVFTIADHVQYKFPAIYSGYTNSNTIIVVNDNYPEDKYSVNAFISIDDTIVLGQNSNKIVNISNNIIYFSSSLFATGNSSNLISMTLTKDLTSSNILLYTTAV
jgi:hypothetical protein